MSAQNGDSSPGYASRRSLIGLSGRLVLSGAPIAIAVMYGVGYGVYWRFFHVFGLRPENVGLNQGAIVAQAGIAAGLLFVLFASWALVGWTQFVVIRATQSLVEEGRPLKKDVVRYVAVAGAPLASVIFLPQLASAGIQRDFVQSALAVITGGSWLALVAQTGRRRAFAMGAGVIVALGVVGRVLSLASHGVGVVLPLLELVTLGLLAGHAYKGSSWHWVRSASARISVPVFSLCLATGARGVLKVWLLSAWLPAGVVWFFVMMFRGEFSTEALDRTFPAWRRLAALAVAAAIVGTSGVWVADREDSAIGDALKVKAGRTVKSGPFDFFPIAVSPAGLLVRTDDPLHLCGRKLVARLLGRDGSIAYVLLRPPTASSSAEGFVVPLSDSDYVVATGVPKPRLCEPITS